MNILVTGINGFIGKNLKIKLQNDMKNKYIFATTSDCLDCIKFEKNYYDIDKKLKNENIECIVHLASVIPFSFQNLEFNDIFLPNAIMMDNLYKFSLNKNIKKFIYISSFGSMEDYNNYKMKDYYTLSKIHGEHVCAMLESRGIETASLRISSPYGQYSNPKSVLNIFVKNALMGLDINVYGSGKREQNFIYVDDVIKAIELFINTNNKINGIYSIVSDNNTSMINLAKIIKEICKSESKINVGTYIDAQENFKPIYDYNRAYNEIGFKPQYDIYTGLKKYIEWYVKNR
ncbi:NAD-dependent epimerase/dehydratase family protein [Clostridium nigeriense]|uniref:NAD-dependent epimerase/dehydratase family protein n=1 Tax=Clostridium nigeriense TaxID=1805470 RepID=UPI00082AE2B6|nr:NAD(P)-dependent oxidoreductase [Clostridium nigeriense]